jgi:hypothetical protein
MKLLERPPSLVTEAASEPDEMVQPSNFTTSISEERPVQRERSRYAKSLEAFRLSHSGFLVSSNVSEKSVSTSPAWPVWVALTDARPHLARFQLLEIAARQLSRLLADGSAHPSDLEGRTLGRFVRRFVADGGPTPQLAATEYGSIEIAWVAGKSTVGAIFDEGGGYSVWARDSTGRELFDIDVDGELPPEIGAQIVDVLAEMSTKVRLAVPEL